MSDNEFEKWLRDREVTLSDGRVYDLDEIFFRAKEKARNKHWTDRLKEINQLLLKGYSDKYLEIEILEMARKHGTAIFDFVPSMASDKEILKLAMKNEIDSDNARYCMRNYVSDEFKKDQEFMMELEKIKTENEILGEDYCFITALTEGTENGLSTLIDLAGMFEYEYASMVEKNGEDYAFDAILNKIYENRDYKFDFDFRDFPELRRIKEEGKLWTIPELMLDAENYLGIDTLRFASEELKNNPEFMEKVQRIRKEKELKSLQKEDKQLDETLSKAQQLEQIQENGTKSVEE